METTVTILEIFETYILPSAGAVGGMTMLIVFILSTRNRKAEREKIEAEREKIKAEKTRLEVEAKETMTLTPAKLQQMITATAESVTTWQHKLIENLQEQIGANKADAEAKLAQLQCQMDEKDQRIEELAGEIAQLRIQLSAKEDSIETLTKKLAAYELENEQLRTENRDLRKKVEDQQIEINQLKIDMQTLKGCYEGQE